MCAFVFIHAVLCFCKKSEDTNSSFVLRIKCEETEIAETLLPLLKISLCSYLRQCVYLNASIALAFILLLPRTIMKSFEWVGDSWPVWLMHTPVSSGRVA